MFIQSAIAGRSVDEALPLVSEAEAHLAKMTEGKQRDRLSLCMSTETTCG